MTRQPSDASERPGLEHVTRLASTPFELDRKRPAVFWASGPDPYENTRKVLANIDLSPSAGKTVLLKPNAGRSVQPGTGITTHPRVVAAAIDAFREAGAAAVAVAESPITGVAALDAFETTGIAAVAQSRQCPLIDMDVHRYVSVDVPDGVAIKSLKLCREVTEFDILVSMPVMKTHMHTRVTLSVKNMKGCLWRRSKVDLHMLGHLPGHAERPLDVAIADMSSVLRPHLSLVDGTIGMEGLGPSAGTPRPVGVVLAGVDAFATDAIASTIMGICPRDVPHLRIASERGYGPIEPDSIAVSPDGWEHIVEPFALPPEELSIEFAGFTILDEQSCSACQSTLLMFLKKYGGRLREGIPADKDITIAIGKGHQRLPADALCIGNCTARHKNGRVFLYGCPPVASEILALFETL